MRCPDVLMSLAGGSGLGRRTCRFSDRPKKTEPTHRPRQPLGGGACHLRKRDPSAMPNVQTLGRAEDLIGHGMMCTWGRSADLN